MTNRSPFYAWSLWLSSALCVGSSSAFLLPHSQSLSKGPSRSNNDHVLCLSNFVPDNDATTIPSNGGSYIRWKTRSCNETQSDVWELQTAVTTFQKFNPTTNERSQVQLHAQVHMANQDYFDYYNSPAFSDAHDEVLYELLVDDSLLGLSPDKSGRVVTQPLQASLNDEAVAKEYGWACQVNAMDYTHPKWKHADFSRQEYLQLNPDHQSNKNNNNKPLWQSSQTTFFQPALLAFLLGPPSLFVQADTSSTTTTTTTTNNNQRKLFTNLFLPGNQLTGWLRAMLWLTVPAPEMSVLLLDWSSLFLSSSKGAQFSPVTLPILQSLTTLQFAKLRRLVFGQVLVSGNSATSSSSNTQNQAWNRLVTQRNDHALRVLQSSLQRKSSLSATTTTTTPKKQIAMLYGCSHCPDLHQKIVADFGFSPIKTEWRTAWSVSVPKTFEGGGAPKSNNKPSVEKESIFGELYSYLPPTAWTALVLLVPLYLGVGAVDWIDTIHSSYVSMLDHQDPAAFAGDWILYLLRHVALYVGVSKFALEWQEPNRNGRGG